MYVQTMTQVIEQMAENLDLPIPMPDMPPMDPDCLFQRIREHYAAKDREVEALMREMHDAVAQPILRELLKIHG